MMKLPYMKQEPIIVEAEIGKRIKTFRKTQKITLDKLAQQTGYSKGYLSKLEKSDKAPPVATLETIARALNVTISALLGEDTQSISLCLVRKDESPFVTRDGTAFGYAYEAMAYNYPDRMMEVFLLTLPLGRKKRVLYQHEGEEVLFMIQGTMKFFHGANEYTVNEGDCLYFDSSIPHFGESIGSEEVKCLMVICNFVPSGKDFPAS